MALVKKGLKVGSTFEENGIKYTVIKVLANGNYISKRADKAGGKGKSDGETVDADVKNDGDTV